MHSSPSCEEQAKRLYAVIALLQKAQQSQSTPLATSESPNLLPSSTPTLPKEQDDDQQA
jgi:hypothetical protein